jgi:hypothetical protein
MQTTLELRTLSMSFFVAIGIASSVNAQQAAPSGVIQSSSVETSPFGAEWLKMQLAREAAFRNGTPGVVTGNLPSGQPQTVAIAENNIPIAPETRIQLTPSQPPATDAQPPTTQDGKAPIQPAQQPASPIRRIPELVVPNTSLQGVGTGVLPKDALQDYPFEKMALPVGMTRDGDWTELCACWQASGICHLPLYFEEPMLERHGQQRYPCLQPMISGVRFIGNIAMLPYYMQLDRPWEEQSVLGSYRPGTAAPALYHRPPYRADAVTAEGLTTAAILIAVP